MSNSDCKCNPESWGYADPQDICTEPEFEDLHGTCFKCYHGRQCHKEYWETFGSLYYEEKDNG